MVPEILDLHLPEEGIGHNLAIVKIEKNYPGQAIKVAHALWGAGQMMFNKIMILIDQDIDIRDHNQVLDALNKNYKAKRDTHFSRGPLDILDHSAPAFSYGGKVMFDATVKHPEESGNLVHSFEKEEETPLFFTHSKDVLKGKINVIVDAQITDLYSQLWIWGSNCDPIRDSYFVEDKLVMDSTTKKKGHNVREWPAMALSAKETIEAIDNKWSKLGLGEFIESPSLKFI